jgi:hypothetical protein
MSAMAPPGRDENPTAWPKRLRIAALAVVGLAIATYLTLYQLGVLADVWDPFFAHGSPAVLDWTHPFPDAALGVLAYAAEVALSFIGGPLAHLARVRASGGSAWRALWGPADAPSLHLHPGGVTGDG